MPRRSRHCHDRVLAIAEREFSEAARSGARRRRVCDGFGRVFDTSWGEADAVYAGLYIADTARIPTALGVNPSLTISALALR